MVIKQIELLSDGHFQIDMGMLVYGKERYYGQKYMAALKPLLVTSDDGYILIDTGIGEPPEPYSKYMTIKRDHTQKLWGQLRHLDLCPEDIAAVINTHLHFDHCGNNMLFEDAEFYVQRDELEYARSPHRFQQGGYIPDSFDFKGVRFNTRQGPYQVRDGLQVIPTPGHTPGHQSVLICMGEDIGEVHWEEEPEKSDDKDWQKQQQRFVYCGDVAPLEENLVRRNIVGVLYNPVDALKSIDLLRKFKGKYIYSHDNQQVAL